MNNEKTSIYADGKTVNFIEGETGLGKEVIMKVLDSWVNYMENIGIIGTYEGIPITFPMPKIGWIPFDKNNPPLDLPHDVEQLVLIRDDDHSNGRKWVYSVDLATPYGSYIDNFWDTFNDWREGQQVEVVAYAKLPVGYYVERKNN